MKEGGINLEEPRKYASLKPRNGWIPCPICKQNRRLLYVVLETEVKNLPVYCSECGNQIFLNISAGIRFS